MKTKIGFWIGCVLLLAGFAAACVPVTPIPNFQTLPAATITLPGPVLTQTITPQPDSVFTGSVVIEEGRCCAGGTAGTQIDLQVDFTANSSAAPVTEMRVQQGWQCLHGGRPGGKLGAV